MLEKSLVNLQTMQQFINFFLTLNGQIEQLGVH